MKAPRNWGFFYDKIADNPPIILKDLSLIFKLLIYKSI